MSTDLYKNRSYLGCHSAAFQFLCSNISFILRKTYAYVIMGAVLVGLYSVANIYYFHDDTMLSTIMGALATLALTAASIFIGSHIKTSLLCLINKAPFKDNIRKMLRLTTFGCLITILAAIIYNLCVYGLDALFASFIKSSTIRLASLTTTSVLLLLAMAAILSPMLFSGAKYLVEEGIDFKSIYGVNYRVGIKRLGYLFCQAVIFELIAIVVALFMLTPVVIISVAMLADKYGMAMGDPTGLPAYFPWLFGIATTIMTFICIYLALYFDITIYYAYGNIQTDVNIRLLSAANTEEPTK